MEFLDNDQYILTFMFREKNAFEFWFSVMYILKWRKFYQDS